MTLPFGHEKLIVYQKGLCFVAIRSALLIGLRRRVAACDQLDRGAESILVNTAHASSTWSPKERIVYLGHANGSGLECAACLDVLVANSLLADDAVYPAKSLLAEVVCMLIAMRRTAVHRVTKEHAAYRTKKGRLFDHEEELRAKHDKPTTSIVPNIAEGNGCFTGTNPATFYETPYKATIQSASLVDLATVNGAADNLARRTGTRTTPPHCRHAHRSREGRNS